MVTVLFLPEGTSVRVAAGTTILEAARAAGITIDSPCNGAVVCGKCAVTLPPQDLERVVEKGAHQLSPEERGRGQVLACAAEVHGDIAVLVAEGQSLRDLKIASQGESATVQLAPHITKEYMPERGVTRVYGGGYLLSEEDGDTAKESFGVVVDIGTTTLVVSLVDLAKGSELAAASALNPQSRHAQDVLSRIKIGSEPRGLEKLRSGVIGEINRLIDQVASAAEIGRNRVYEVIFSGNTCMLHLAAGVDPASLGKYPYLSTLACAAWIPAAGTGIDIAPEGLIYLPPIISGYIGADITAGLQAVRLHESEETVLFVDIGTNGEMALCRNGKIWATSTAAGPAFEGMNIRYGMRAGEGAIERCSVSADGSLELRTIAGTEAVGICGSGLMDIVAELVAHKVIGRNGKFVEPDHPALSPKLAERLVERDGRPVFLLTDNVWLSQKDVRQVQLAKGAIRAGVEFLLREAAVPASELKQVLIAGSFGFHLTAESLTTIGLLPAATAGRIRFVGNTAKSGGEAFLLNHEVRREMSELVEQVQVVELANCTDFDRVFVEALSF
ncbi:probable electron transfer protein [Citrifermentans bremense]|uniref:Probable electron transfer protein n=1 Tax=Citrifermentans bremense TaxID=60035 RepID=A0A6S6M204_9BACT|nr:ASKHA domain-containing protein [Citrifermentans bremense]BCG47678.1 probable electron transfer protein [Citrifermentans bremense]